MGLMPWILLLAILAVANYWASRALRPAMRRSVLLTTCLPAIALVSYTGSRLAYAIVNAEDVDRRFRQGDLTYFGADMAFGVCAVLAALWIFAAYAGFRWGRSHRRSE
jgi:hypothetical protein